MKAVKVNSNYQRIFQNLCLTSFLIASFFLLPIIAQGGEGDVEKANWLYNIEEAKQQSSEGEKLILLSFSGSDWCVPCIKLEKNLYSNSEFVDFANDNLVLVKLDFPAKKANKLSDSQLKHNEQLAELYNKKGVFPLMVMVDESGKVKGYVKHPSNSVEAYIESMESIID